MKVMKDEVEAKKKDPEKVGAGRRHVIASDPAQGRIEAASQTHTK